MLNQLQAWSKLPIRQWQVGTKLGADTIYLLDAPGLEERFADYLNDFFQSDDIHRVSAIAIQKPKSMELQSMVTILVNHAAQLTELNGLYLGGVLAGPEPKSGDTIDFKDPETFGEQYPLTSLLEAFPAIRYLSIAFIQQHGSAYGYKIEKAQLPNLEKLHLEVDDCACSVLYHLDTCEFQNLRHLSVTLGNQGCQAYHFLGKVSSKPFPNLTYMDWDISVNGDQFAEELSRSNLFREVTDLTFTGGNLTDSGAELLTSSMLGSKLSNIRAEQHIVSDEVIQNLKEQGVNFCGESAAADDTSAEYARQQRLHRLVAEGIDESFHLWVICFPSEGYTCRGELLESPTWIEVVQEANRMLIEMDDLMHHCLERAAIIGEDPDDSNIKFGEFWFGS